MLDLDRLRGNSLRTFIQSLRQADHLANVPLRIRIGCEIKRLGDERVTSCGSDGVDVIARGLRGCCVYAEVVFLDDLEGDCF
jgi:hypothetical protein